MQTQLVDLIESKCLDILALAEYIGDPHEIVLNASVRGINIFFLQNIGCQRINIFSKFNDTDFHIRNETSYYSIREFRKDGYLPVLLAFVHLPSKLHQSEDDQAAEVIYLRSAIEELENTYRVDGTIVVGDFNMNPYDKGMIGAQQMHSISCLRTAQTDTRVIKGREHSFFYNPMWNLLGDFNGAAGSHFYRDSSYYVTFWNMLDQVILRPSIANRLDKSSLCIMTVINNTQLINANGRPSLSDHLPIFFKLNLTEGIIT
ncbi:MAG: hypothetical protein Q7S87_17290 [Agitococcus sp.]|nr:hypothetical protein [Agitococcus sp.]